MKKQLFALCLPLILSSFSLKALAQDETPQPPVAPKWAPEKGYWVVESNIHTPRHSVISFFNDKGTMVYKEQVDGKKLKLKRKKTLMRLKSVLDQSVTAWERNHQAKENENLVSAAFGKE